MTTQELLVPWPPGDNDTDTIVHGHHLNLTSLQDHGYLLWKNETISNVTTCKISLPKYLPDDIAISPNGTWTGSTSCYTPVYRIGLRSAIGMGLAVFFGILLILILVNLAQHGKTFIKPDKRFYPIGRRWQWYWCSWVCAMALIGLFFGVDIDRYYVMEIPIVINMFMWYLMQWGATAVVWEAIRHWGSWKERQFIDPNPFVLKETDRRGMFEFWLPLWFYFWLWMNFFMIIPRNWEPFEKQRSPEQTETIAVPGATDMRFRAGAFMLFVCWLTIVVSLWHSIKHYEPRNRGYFNRIVGFVSYIPVRFVLQVPLLLVLVGYQALCAYDFYLSPADIHGNNVAIYVGGYVPSALILVTQIVDGFIRPNEDKELLRQRRERGDAIDRELGITKKPNWWARNGEVGGDTMRDMVQRNVEEINGRRGRLAADNVATRRALASQATAAARGGTIIEMNDMAPPNDVSRIDESQPPPPPYEPKKTQGGGSGQDAMQIAARMLFPNSPASGPSSPATTAVDTQEGTPQQGARPDHGIRTPSTMSGISTTAYPPQQIRSMLDV